MAVLEIDNANLDGLFGVRKLATSGYKGATGDESLDLHGFEVELLKDHRLRFWLINHRPPVDANGRLLDASKLGANSTIEIFDLAKGSSTLEHVATIAHEAVITPNNLALSGTGGVLISNDKSTKGWSSSINILYVLTVLPRTTVGFVSHTKRPASSTNCTLTYDFARLENSNR